MSQLKVTIVENHLVPKNRHDGFHVYLFNGVISERHRFASLIEAEEFAAKYIDTKSQA